MRSASSSCSQKPSGGVANPPPPRQPSCAAEGPRRLGADRVQGVVLAVLSPHRGHRTGVSALHTRARCPRVREEDTEARGRDGVPRRRPVWLSPSLPPSPHRVVPAPRKRCVHAASPLPDSWPSRLGPFPPLGCLPASPLRPLPPSPRTRRTALDRFPSAFLPLTPTRSPLPPAISEPLMPSGALPPQTTPLSAPGAPGLAGCEDRAQPPELWVLQGRDSHIATLQSVPSKRRPALPPTRLCTAVSGFEP